MPRAFSQPDHAQTARDPGAGEWHALRGELVALLDKVESRYSTADEDDAPADDGLTQRMRDLREQVEAPPPNLRHREALRTVKRAVDRFSDRDGSGEVDELTAAINEIRSRQGAQPHPLRRASDMPELRDLGELVTGMTQRLERLEGELRAQRSNAGTVRDVASQVQQLTQVVELLAGAIGETGQVKRLETQIAALANMVENAPRTDVSAINSRLDDVSATVGKLAELQVQQMEREIVRESRSDDTQLAPVMHSIEASVRSVYDRIDAIERNVALSSVDFERLTQEMAAFTHAMRDNADAPGALVGRVDALVQQLGDMDGGSEVLALRNDIAALRSAVLEGIEPRFNRLESRIDALSERMPDTSAVESQLNALMARMDDAGAQLDGLAQLYHSADAKPDFDQLASIVAERTSQAVVRNTPSPVAMFGADSLKSIEDRITGLIRSAGKTPDYETLADLVATRTSEAVTKAAPAAEPPQDIDALEKRMTALFNTAGKDTAERLARLETMLTERNKAEKAAAALAATPVPVAPPAKKAAAVAEDPFADMLQPSRPGADKLDTILANLSKGPADAMPANPTDEKPLVDRGPAAPVTQRAAPAAPAPAVKASAPLVDAPTAGEPRFDPETVQRPPRPQSSFAPQDQNPFAETAKAPAPAAEPKVPPTSTSTFVAAARRAQRAKQDEATPKSGGSLISRALSRVRQDKAPDAGQDAMPVAPLAKPESKAKPEKPARSKREPKPKTEAAPPSAAPVDSGAKPSSFLARQRRPLLLAATLVAVSLLALNLVLQRSGPAQAPAPAAEVDVPEETAPVGEQSSVVPPRVIDLIDPTSTGSINPGQPMSFSRPQQTSEVTALPPTLQTDGTQIEIASASLGAPAEAADITGSIPTQPVAAAEAEVELPAEAVGPLELREAAANGNAMAQFEVAAIYGEGRAVEQDFGQSAIWYERAAEQGFVPAQYRLGNLFETGSGVEQDFEQARLWYERGAEAGNRMAMHNLAALYAGGQLGEQQFEQAAEWFGKAAALGMTDSQFNLGMLYARGLGVEQDFEQSFKWFSLAANSGDSDAAQARDDMAESLSAEAVSRIGAEVGAWRIESINLAANFAPIGTWIEDFEPGETITTRDVVTRVQQALNRLGFDLGTPDGVAGPKTGEAIRAFERDTGMSETGAINPRLLAVLGSQPV